MIDRTPAVSRGNIGFEIVNLSTGELVAQQNSARYYIPASNTKLYTTALALERLGPEYKFQTELRTSGPWQPGQASIANLQLVGGGDPNLSGRVLPYQPDSNQPDSKSGDPLCVLNELADKLAAAGVHEITGDVEGVATRYPGDRYPDGWTIDDSLYEYGAPVSALTLNDNAVSLTLSPSSAGELAALEVSPPVPEFIVNNQVITDETRAVQVRFFRPPGSNEITLTGTIGMNAEPWKQDAAVIDPALFAAESLVYVLEERGITVRGEPRAVYAGVNAAASKPRGAGAGPVLAVHESCPLAQSVQVINKVSQNLHAEMLLREVAFVSNGLGTLEAGVAQRQSFLKEAGITPDDTGFSLVDGSGLARQNLTTPDSTVKLLEFMWSRPERDVWLKSLPIGGIDGSLQHRFQKISGADRVHAKTGSISHVNTLSGYIETKGHQWLAFSAMVNATAGHNADVLAFLDRFCGILLDY